VESTLSRMAATASEGSDGAPVRELRPLVVMLPRQPGSRESRYAHLLGGPVEAASRPPAPDRGVDGTSTATVSSRVTELEVAVAALRAAFAGVEARLAKLELEG
jgi:uncharacterized protein YceH (UPF0502 family)